MFEELQVENFTKYNGKSQDRIQHVLQTISTISIKKSALEHIIVKCYNQSQSDCLKSNHRI